jgi:biopolymer transport protein ExbD
MAGVSVEGGGRRRSLDADVNMVPMIDVLMVTISFLLLTAVWTHMARLEASARVPGDRGAPPCETDPGCKRSEELHVDMGQPERFVLVWRQNGTVLRTRDVMRRDDRTTTPSALRFPELADALRAEPRPTGVARAVVHAPDGARYEELIAVMDAIDSVRHKDAAATPAFLVTLALN